MTTSQSSAVWNGNLMEGSGLMRLGEGGYEGPFTKASRFETGDGTNPEELIGAAHAGCFSMFLPIQKKVPLALYRFKSDNICGVISCGPSSKVSAIFLSFSKEFLQ